MKVSRHLHAPAALPPKKKLPFPIKKQRRVSPRVDLGALEQMKLLPLQRTEPRFLGLPACRNKYRATETAHDKRMIMNRKGNLALRRVDGTAVTIGTVKSAAATVTVTAGYYCH